MAEYDVTVTRSMVTRETFTLTVRDGEPGPTMVAAIADIKAGRFDDAVWERETLHEVVEVEDVVPANDYEDGEPVED